MNTLFEWKHDYVLQCLTRAFGIYGLFCIQCWLPVLPYLCLGAGWQESSGCHCTATKANGLHLQGHHQQRWRHDHLTQPLSGCIWSTGYSSGPYCSRRMQADWRGSKESYEDNQRPGEPALRGKTKRSYSSSPSRRDITSPWRKEGSGARYYSIPTFKRWMKNRWRLFLHKETHGKGKRQQVQVALGEVPPQHKKVIFQSDNSWSLEQPPQGCDGLPTAGSFQDTVEQVLDNLT